jgi:predicted GIY-YIG superfamily endonuclease
MHDCVVHYVYLLNSKRSYFRRYIGVTADLKRRIAEHNSGKFPHTATYAPWTLVTYVAFSNKQQADKFELYLKSGSGHAFANRHLW